MGMRVFDLCPDCTHLAEIKTMDPPVEIPVRHCGQVVEVRNCVRLGRTWPVCRSGENVFEESIICRGFYSGTPRQISFLVVALK
mgnify:CR=1